MIVIADTTPLRHLIAIGRGDILRKIYGEIVVPTAVWRELHADSTPTLVLQFVTQASEWLRVIEPSVVDPVPDFDFIDPGEREAIQLAIELSADLLLIDDRDGRETALRFQMPVTGTLGVLERADILGLISDFPQVIAELEASGFYLSARLRNAVLERSRARSR